MLPETVPVIAAIIGMFAAFMIALGGAAFWSRGARK